MRQADLFDAGRMPEASPAAVSPDPAIIRCRLHALLEMVRSAQELPWATSRARAQEHLFYNMANWLPAEERDALRVAFATELDRLRR